jgi:hypothetical protein
LVKYSVIKVTINQWFFFNDAKGGKYHSPKKQHYLSVLSHYNLWGCFLPPFWSHRVWSSSMSALLCASGGFFRHAEKRLQIEGILQTGKNGSRRADRQLESVPTLAFMFDGKAFPVHKT